eukprot:m51a1_g9781 hypothetical protein (336) ;mRNA; f:1684485-1685962
MNRWSALGAAAGAVGLAAGSLYLVDKLRLFSGPRCPHSPDLTGKTVAVTGTTRGGMGHETALRLARLGAAVVLLDRSAANSAASRKHICDECPGAEGRVECVVCDLADVASVAHAAAEVRRRHAEVHALVCNAGVMACPLSATRQGWELQFGTNHLGHFALVQGLLPSLEAGRARVVVVTSYGYSMAPACGVDFGRLRAEQLGCAGGAPYSAWAAYGQSKLANILFAKELQRRMGPRGITALAADPGDVDTNLMRHMPCARLVALLARPFSKLPEEGAQTQLYCALAPEGELVPGGYYSDCRAKETAAVCGDEELARRLWEVSEEATRGFTGLHD